MNITLVQKIKHNGQPCSKSVRVLSELDRLGLRSRINQIVTADERNPASEGYALAAQHNVEAAPFFIIEQADGHTHLYTAYQRFLKEVLHQQTSEEAEISEIMAQHPDLDFI
ncbi:hypothetical protein [Acaryochloris marina]|uniref:hypothetical protein n=1 Tax=Acaryochloris marina TaxID=155978 RepID=UPI0021C36D81|nr:hypothetical protein [Acaryochloris marina]BDM83380.1 hypothetical protein AM10699_62410 [Acaryochloris marina MBIC10699]